MNFGAGLHPILPQNNIFPQGKHTLWNKEVWKMTLNAPNRIQKGPACFSWKPWGTFWLPFAIHLKKHPFLHFSGCACFNTCIWVPSQPPPPEAVSEVRWKTSITPVQRQWHLNIGCNMIRYLIIISHLNTVTVAWGQVRSTCREKW